jgi:NTP pyrophosphatase (non-canonical NTP hydrolase)
MNVSSLLQSTDYYDYYRTKNNAASQSAATTAEGKTEESLNLFDAISDKSEAKAPPPPPPPSQEPDFENMSDDDLKSYLTKLQEESGIVFETADKRTIESLTEEELDGIRSELIAMQQEKFQSSLRQGLEEMTQNGGMLYAVANLDDNA